MSATQLKLYTNERPKRERGRDDEGNTEQESIILAHLKRLTRKNNGLGATYEELIAAVGDEWTPQSVRSRMVQLRRRNLVKETDYGKRHSNGTRSSYSALWAPIV